MCKEIFKSFNICHSDIHNITGFPSDHISRRNTVDGVKKMDSHFRKDAVCT